MRKYMMVFWIMILALIPVFQAFAGDSRKKDTWHTVRWGQTMIGVAASYGVDPGYLASYNGLKNRDRIFAGQRIRIPRSRHARSRTIEVYVYTVKYGDTLFGIAAKFGQDPFYIAAINRLLDLNFIYRGQKLYVPRT
jgi:LysM repeat protein